MDHQAGPWPGCGQLRGRGKGHRGRLAAQVVVLGIRDDADDFIDGGRIVRFLNGAQRVPDWIGAAQKPAHEGLVYHRDTRGSLGVIFVESTATDNRNAHGVEVAWTYPGELRIA